MRDIRIHTDAIKILNEPVFEIFKHSDLICCIQRMSFSGVLNGYVAVPEFHPFYGKEYGENVVVVDKEAVEFNGNYIGLLCHSLSGKSDTDLLSIDLALNVHGGVTYSRDHLNGIDKELFGNLWWFGFDTSHCGDLSPYENEFDRQFQSQGKEYRDFAYVKGETIKLAEQLSKYFIVRESIENI